MKQRKKLIAFFLSTIMLLSLLAGCGGNRKMTVTSREVTGEATEPTPTPLPTATPVPTAAPVTAFSDKVTQLDGLDVYPYLLPGIGDGIVRVRWCGTETPEGYVVVYGESEEEIRGGRGTAVPSSFLVAHEIWNYTHPFIYEARLTVEPSTRYKYGICHPGEIPEILYTFRTPDEDHLTMAFVGDSHLVNSVHAGIMESTLEAALGSALAGGRGLDLICHLGDIIDNRATSPGLFVNNAGALRSIPVSAVCGNHDGQGNVYGWFPMDAIDSSLLDYWYVRGNVLFVGLNAANEDYVDHAEYLRHVMATAGEHDWTVVMLHYAMRSNGEHANDRQCIGFRNALEPVMSELDVDLIVAGHDHEYDRSILVNADGPVEGGDGNDLIKQPGDLLYITIPCATGVKYYKTSRTPEYPIVAEGMEKDYGFLLADFSEDVLHLSICRTVDGARIDEVTLRRAE